MNTLKVYVECNAAWRLSTNKFDVLFKCDYKLVGIGGIVSVKNIPIYSGRKYEVEILVRGIDDEYIDIPLAIEVVHGNHTSNPSVFEIALVLFKGSR